MNTTPLHLLSVERIWSHAEHNAMPDLIFYNEQWLCVFRESNLHYKGVDGTIRIISSTDTLHWKPIAEFSEDKVDLRDPKFSIGPDGRLQLLAEAVVYDPLDKKYVTRRPCTTFSTDARQWEPWNLILEPEEWLWRITWQNGVCYGISYRYSNPQVPRDEWLIKLFSSPDGINFTLMQQWDITGYPSEATIRFSPSGQMIVLLRRDNHFNDNHAWVGVSDPPFVEWKWSVTSRYFGGPNFLILPDKGMLAGGRVISVNPYGIFGKTVLSWMTHEEILTPALSLPSAGDCSYPGMVYQEGILYLAYYSSHEENTAIYFARVAC